VADFQFVTSTIRTTFETAWATAQPTIPLYHIDEEPPIEDIQNSTYVRLSITFGDGNQVAMGGGTTGRRVRTVGIAAVQVFQPNGQGDGQLYRLADSIASVWQVSTIAGIVFRATSAQAIQRDGSWVMLPVFTPFQADEYVT
jgi:hypothetical protein